MNGLRILVPAFVALGALAHATDAAACGGCFRNPNENASVVTDHRMILSLSKDQTTLYDQIRYQGDPASFAWVLPIRGAVTVGLSADVVFSVLDSSTRTTIIAPQPPACPPLDCCSDGDPLAGDASTSFDGGVVVTKEQVVGPYATVQLSSSDPQALNAWLTQNGFAIPPDVQPIVAAYVGEKFDFLAMKLLPGKGVSSMRPIRVTTPGAAAALPLRMVAAGTGPVVGITLWVLGEGRYEPTNFPTFEITGPELTWDFATQRSNYSELRAAKTAASAGRGWERESSMPASIQGLKNLVLGNSFVLPDGGVGSDYAPDGTKSALQVRDEDLETLFHGITPADLRITRLRADLAHAALDADLGLGATSDQSIVPSTRTPGATIHPPVCPTSCAPPRYACPHDGGTADGDVVGVTLGGGGCAVAAEPDGAPTSVIAIALLALGSVVRSLRRRFTSENRNVQT